jgi:hypothetical protein
MRRPPSPARSGMRGLVDVRLRCQPFRVTMKRFENGASSDYGPLLRRTGLSASSFHFEFCHARARNGPRKVLCCIWPHCLARQFWRSQRDRQVLGRVPLIRIWQSLAYQPVAGASSAKPGSVCPPVARIAGQTCAARMIEPACRNFSPLKATPTMLLHLLRRGRLPLRTEGRLRAQMAGSPPTHGRQSTPSLFHHWRLLRCNRGPKATICTTDFSYVELAALSRAWSKTDRRWAGS